MPYAQALHSDPTMEMSPRQRINDTSVMLADTPSLSLPVKIQRLSSGTQPSLIFFPISQDFPVNRILAFPVCLLNVLELVIQNMVSLLPVEVHLDIK